MTLESMRPDLGETTAIY